MKRLSIKCRLIIFMMILTTHIVLFASNGTETYTVNLTRTSTKDHTLKPDEEGTRIPSRPITCIITNQGVETEITSEEILLYEIWDDNSNCIAATSDDMVFANYIFSSAKKELQIRIITEEYIYIGYISTL